MAAIMVTACGSGSTPSPPPTQATGQPPTQPPAGSSLIPPLAVASIGEAPDDIPSGPPSCPGDAPVPFEVAAEISTLVSGCANALGTEVILSNLSDAVLDISSGDFPQPQIQAYPTKPDDLLLTWDDVEVLAQNAAEAGLRPPLGVTLVPVGGQVAAAAGSAVHLLVRVDESATEASRAVALVTGYVADNLREAIPEDSKLAYEQSIAGCVNSAYSLWQNLDQQSAAAAGDTVDTALETVQSCQELQQKLEKDHAEEIEVAAAGHNISEHELDPDLTKVADTAGQDDWESTIADVLEDAGRVAEDH